MLRNLHTLDRVARILIGIACVYVGFFEQALINNQIIAILVGVFGVVNVGASLFSHCPVYKLAGISTYAAPSNESQA